MSFHLGKPIFVTIVLALVSGLGVGMRAGRPNADLRMETFTASGYASHSTVIPVFEERTGLSVSVSLIQNRALNVRLAAGFLSNASGEELPDLVEVEISDVGKFFRPPVEQVGFVDLTDRLKASGWYDEIAETRLAPWTKEGRVFGVPSAAHPVGLAYRADLFQEAGIDMEAIRTWPEFHEACIQFRDYWRARGFPHRHAVELNQASAEAVLVMLQQRGINPIDDFNRIHVNNPKVAETIAFFAQMVAGPDAVGGQSSGGLGGFAKDLAEGNLCAFIAPDWRAAFLRTYGESISGTMRLRPLPIFEPGDAPTATWGGTMIGITKACDNPDAAWELLKMLYFSEEAQAHRRQRAEILPAVKRFWSHPAYHGPNPFFGGQRTTELYIKLAEQIRPRYVTPATTTANQALAHVVSRAVDYVEDRGTDGLEAQCQVWLNEAAVDLQRRIDHWQFEE